MASVMGGVVTLHYPSIYNFHGGVEVLFLHGGIDVGDSAFLCITTYIFRYIRMYIHNLSAGVASRAKSFS